MSTQQPETTHGQDPYIRVGNFTCTCGYVIIDSERGDKSREILTTNQDSTANQDERIVCSECGREWWVVRNEYWVNEGDE